MSLTEFEIKALKEFKSAHDQNRSPKDILRDGRTAVIALCQNICIKKFGLSKFSEEFKSPLYYITKKNFFGKKNPASGMIEYHPPIMGKIHVQIGRVFNDRNTSDYDTLEPEIDEAEQTKLALKIIFEWYFNIYYENKQMTSLNIPSDLKVVFDGIIHNKKVNYVSFSKRENAQDTSKKSIKITTQIKQEKKIEEDKFLKEYYDKIVNSTEIPKEKIHSSKSTNVEKEKEVISAGTNETLNQQKDQTVISTEIPKEKIHSSKSTNVEREKEARLVEANETFTHRNDENSKKGKKSIITIIVIIIFIVCYNLFRPKLQLVNEGNIFTSGIYVDSTHGFIRKYEITVSAGNNATCVLSYKDIYAEKHYIKADTGYVVHDTLYLFFKTYSLKDIDDVIKITKSSECTNCYEGIESFAPSSKVKPVLIHLHKIE